MAGAPKGNKNAVKVRIWSEAIRKEVLSRKRLAKLAKTLCDMAEKGDIAAMKELGNRLEGKSAQIIQGVGEEGSIPLNIQVTYVRAKDRAPGQT